MSRLASCLLFPLVLGLLACAGSPDPACVLRVGTSGDYAPFSEAGVHGSRRGFDIDLGESFASDRGCRVQWVSFRWPDLQGSIAADRFDVAMSGVTVRPERSVEGRFSVPVARTGAVVIVREELAAELGDEDPVRVLDAAGRRIAVNAGGHLERVTRKAFQAASVRAIPENAAVPETLANGEVDAVVTDTLEAPRWLAKLPGSVALPPFTQDWKAYWMRAGDDELARSLDDWLIAREAGGQLEGWRNTWFGEAVIARTATPATALQAASDERLALMPFVAGYKRAHGLAVVDAQREARVLAAAFEAVQAAAEELELPVPERARVEAFYREQIDAAVALQRGVLAEPADPAHARFGLAEELRPALIRIGDRMARLLVREMAADASSGNGS